MGGKFKPKGGDCGGPSSEGDTAASPAASLGPATSHRQRGEILQRVAEGEVGFGERRTDIGRALEAYGAMSDIRNLPGEAVSREFEDNGLTVETLAAIAQHKRSPTDGSWRTVLDHVAADAESFEDPGNRTRARRLLIDNNHPSVAPIDLEVDDAGWRRLDELRGKVDAFHERTIDTGEWDAFLNEMGADLNIRRDFEKQRVEARRFAKGDPGGPDVASSHYAGVGHALARLDAIGFLDGARTIAGGEFEVHGSRRSWDKNIRGVGKDPASDSIGSYFTAGGLWDKGGIYLHPYKAIGHNQEWNGGLRQYSRAGSAEDLYIHELGHYLHHLNDPDEYDKRYSMGKRQGAYGARRGLGVRDKTENAHLRAIAEQRTKDGIREISEYGTTNVHEFVAETFLDLATSKVPVRADRLRLYLKFGGWLPQPIREKVEGSI